MKIAISGLHGQGKTTLINALKPLAEFKDYTFKDSPTRALIGHHNINENGSQDTQMCIMAEHYKNQLCSNVILDRCALDGMAYTKYFEPQITLSLFDSMNSLYHYLIQQYDILFYIEPELPLVNDGVRSANIPFFEAVKLNFEYLIKDHKIKITSVSGSVEQRVKKVLDTYKIYSTTQNKL